MNTTAVLKQLDDVISQIAVLQSRAEHDDLSGSQVTFDEIVSAYAKARAAINRISGANSAYLQHFAICDQMKTYEGKKLVAVKGVVKALRDDVAAGYLVELSELIHADLFADFMGAAEHLLSEGYKDAAAVIIGSSLESHLRQLAKKLGIATVVGTKSKKADTLNSELTAAAVYSKLDQKNVTAWLDLRNKAAHGHYSEYTREQVNLLLAAVRDFMTRHSA